jgi:hypothetical protein
MSAFGDSAGSDRGPPPSFWPSLEDAEIEAARFGQPRQHRHVAATVRRPLLGNDEQLRRAVGPRRKPANRSGLRLVESCPLVALAQKPAEVVPLPAQPPAGFAREVFRAARVDDVLIERHALRKPLGGEGAFLPLHARQRTVRVNDGQGRILPVLVLYENVTP